MADFIEKRWSMLPRTGTSMNEFQSMKTKLIYLLLFAANFVWLSFANGYDGPSVEVNQTNLRVIIDKPTMVKLPSTLALVSVDPLLKSGTATNISVTRLWLLNKDYTNSNSGYDLNLYHFPILVVRDDKNNALRMFPDSGFPDAFFYVDRSQWKYCYFNPGPGMYAYSNLFELHAPSNTVDACISELKLAAISKKLTGKKISDFEIQSLINLRGALPIYFCVEKDGFPELVTKEVKSGLLHIVIKNRSETNVADLMVDVVAGKVVASTVDGREMKFDEHSVFGVPKP